MSTASEIFSNFWNKQTPNTHKGEGFIFAPDSNNPNDSSGVRGIAAGSSNIISKELRDYCICLENGLVI